MQELRAQLAALEKEREQMVRDEEQGPSPNPDVTHTPGDRRGAGQTRPDRRQDGGPDGEERAGEEPPGCDRDLIKPTPNPNPALTVIPTPSSSSTPRHPRDLLKNPYP